MSGFCWELGYEKVFASESRAATWPSRWPFASWPRTGPGPPERHLHIPVCWTSPATRERLPFRPTWRNMLKAYTYDRDPLLPGASPVYARLDGFPPLLLQAGTEELPRYHMERMALRASKSDCPCVASPVGRGWATPSPWNSTGTPEAQAALSEVLDFISDFSDRKKRAIPHGRDRAFPSVDQVCLLSSPQKPRRIPSSRRRKKSKVFSAACTSKNTPLRPPVCARQRARAAVCISLEKCLILRSVSNWFDTLDSRDSAWAGSRVFLYCRPNARR